MGTRHSAPGTRSMMLNLPFFERRHSELAERLARFVQQAIEPRAAAADEGDPNDAGREFIRLLAAEGLLRLLVPAAGQPATSPPNFDLRSICLAREIVAGSSALADAVFAVQGLASYAIALAGSDELRGSWLSRLASGEAIGAFALTEPQAGSDIAAIATSARAEAGGYVLNGSKTLISNAGIADLYVVFATTAEQSQNSERAKDRIAAFVVPASSHGLTVTPTIPLMAPHPIAGLVFDNCHVPDSHRLGSEGDGFKLALATLDVYRATVGAAACGVAARALEETRDYASKRKQFGAAIADFQATRLALADMQTDLDAARLLVYRAAWLRDYGADRITREASMAKLFATEAAGRIVDRAVQIHGGLGVTRGAVVERLYREVRALRIYEGTSEIQRLVIADWLLKDAKFSRA